MRVRKRGWASGCTQILSWLSNIVMIQMRARRSSWPTTRHRLTVKKCAQSSQHQQIAAARSQIQTSLRGSTHEGYKPAEVGTVTTTGAQHVSRATTASFDSGNQRSPRPPVGAEIDTAEAIAARYGLNPKSYRQRLRDTISWYRKPQDWTFPVGCREWQDMIRVAEGMLR